MAAMRAMGTQKGFQNKKTVILAGSGEGKSWLAWDLPFLLGDLEAVVLVAPEETQKNEVTASAAQMFADAGIPFVQIVPKPSETRLELPAFRRPSLLIFDDVAGTPLAESGGEVSQQFIRGRHSRRHVAFLAQSRHRIPRPILDNATDIVAHQSQVTEGLARRLGARDPREFMESAARVDRSAVSPWRLLTPPYADVVELQLPQLPTRKADLIRLLRRSAGVRPSRPGYPSLSTALGILSAGNSRALLGEQPWIWGN